MNKYFVPFAFLAACTTETLGTGESVQPDNSTWPWCNGQPGECTVGDSHSVGVCRTICQDSGNPWFTSGCASWEIPGLPPDSIGRCYMQPK